MMPKKVTLEQKIILGQSVRTNNKNEENPESSKIMGLWGQFFQLDLMTKIPHQIDNSPMFGVYSDYESDVDGDYTLTVGMHVTKSNNKEFTQIIIEAGDYLVFKAKGDMPKAVIDTWQIIWAYFETRQDQRKYTTDFEAYLSEDEVEIYIAI